MSEPRDQELSRIYRGAETPEPPQRIDDAILAASRRAAGSRPRTAGSELVRRSSAPVALAATILLTLTVTLMVFQDLPEPTQISMQPGRTEAPAEKPAQAEPTPGAFEKTISQAKSRRDASAPAERVLSSERTGATSPGFVGDTPRASELRDAPEALSKRQGLQESQEVQGPRRARESEPMRASRPMQPAPSAPTPSASPRSETISTPQAAGVGTATASRFAADEAKERSPEKWLEDIRRLKSQGKTPEAERELAEFKKRHPDYRLAEDLR